MEANRDQNTIAEDTTIIIIDATAIGMIIATVALYSRGRYERNNCTSGSTITSMVNNRSGGSNNNRSGGSDRYSNDRVAGNSPSDDKNQNRMSQ